MISAAQTRSGEGTPARPEKHLTEQAQKETDERLYKGEKDLINKELARCYPNQRVEKIGDGFFIGKLETLTYASGTHEHLIPERKFASWQEARDFALQRCSAKEEIVQKPLIIATLSAEQRLAAERYEIFDPRPALSGAPREIPDFVRYQFGKKPKSAHTYEVTIKEYEWQKKVFSLVKSYLRDNPDISRKLGIDDLTLLSPRQAMEIACQMTVDRTKYAKGTQEQRDLIAELADKTTVMQLLNFGQFVKQDENSRGNGVCRNFASTTKIIFEALKAHQKKFNYLQDTHCFISAGGEDIYSRSDFATLNLMSAGHAWNTFVQIGSDGTINHTVVDVTWARRNPEHGGIEGQDRTAERSSVLFNSLKYSQGVSMETSVKQERADQLLCLYGELFSDSRNEKIFKLLCTRFLDCTELNPMSDENLRNMPINARQALWNSYYSIYKDKSSTPHNMKIMFQILGNKISGATEQLVDIYLANYERDGYGKNNLIFENDDLQLLIYRKTKDNPKFEREVNKDDFKKRIAELGIN